jgi:predicted HTH domain antitoxin
MREAGMDEKGMNTFSQQMLAVALYRQGRLSVGCCASLAGMNEADFIDFLNAMGVSVFGNMTAEDMLEESKALARLARLMSKLFSQGRGADAECAANDEDYRNRLFEVYGID